MVGAALALDLSGLEYLRAIAEKRIPFEPPQNGGNRNGG